MIKHGHIFATSFVVLIGVCGGAHAAQNAPSIMSKYGEIQSVNKYSSNPFWTPNSPYNQRFPTPIYATGPDLNTGDCNRIVQNLVSTYCAERQNCSNLRITDVRPNIMVQLSQLPGHNFATSCGGYIDSVFESYKKTYGNSSAGTVNIVPTQTKTTAPSIQVENPFTQKTTEFDERAAELERLQRQTTATAAVTPAAFPKTIDDLSFTDRMANASAGYEPYKDLSAYKTPKFETEDEYYERMKSVLEHGIRYVGARASGCPTNYSTGRGATVSCTPTIDHGTCTTWCTDAGLTNCQTSYTISPSDRDDKTFYGKCTCNTGYEMDGYKCVKPGAPVTPVDPVDPVDPVLPTNYPDPTYMDSNCECTGKYAPDPSNSNKCICANGEDITNDCEPGDPVSTDEYAIFECRGDTIPDVSSIGVASIPSEAFGCYKNRPNSIKKCFKNEYQDGYGLVTNAIEHITGKVYPLGGFLSEYSVGRPIKKLTSNQIELVKKELNNLTEADRKKYCYSKGYWMVFFMKKTTDNKWRPTEPPFILYNKSWNN